MVLIVTTLSTTGSRAAWAAKSLEQGIAFTKLRTGLNVEEMVNALYHPGSFFSVGYQIHHGLRLRPRIADRTENPQRQEGKIIRRIANSNYLGECSPRALSAASRPVPC